ncbi:DinB family protein [Candidatus Parcubacteria bacterium]|nr:MAG: DinB family protein [Candidatus Parcubacteria bacterium]
MKDELIKDLENARKNLLEVISKIPEDFVIDKWGKKELLAHFCGWDEEDVVCIPQILSGQKPKSLRMSMNRFNEENVSKRKDKSVKELLEEMKSSRKNFLKQLSSLTEEQITGFFGTVLGKKEINLLWIIKETIDHDKNHTKDIEGKTDL